MKPRIFILSLFMCLIGQAQEIIDCSRSATTVNRVTEMAIYPGCEEFKGDKRNLIMCFAEKLNNDFSKYFDVTFPTETIMIDGKWVERSIDKAMVSAILEFHVDTKGEITDVKAKGGDAIIFSRAESALKRVAKDLKKQGAKIIPGKMDDGSNATLIMNLPVRLRNPNR